MKMGESITIVGNVASVPERRDLPKGGSVTGFRIAATQRRFDRETSTWVDAHTNWFAVSAFRTLGDNAYRSLHKGDRVIIVGRLRLREWETDAKRGVTAEIEAEAVGHDLLWGASTFRAGAAVSGAAVDSRASSTTSSDMSRAVEAPAEPGWSAPGEVRATAGAEQTPF